MQVYILNLESMKPIKILGESWGQRPPPNWRHWCEVEIFIRFTVHDTWGMVVYICLFLQDRGLTDELFLVGNGFGLSWTTPLQLEKNRHGHLADGFSSEGHTTGLQLSRLFK